MDLSGDEQFKQNGEMKRGYNGDKAVMNHPPNHHKYIGGINHSQMGGLLSYFPTLYGIAAGYMIGSMILEQ